MQLKVGRAVAGCGAALASWLVAGHAVAVDREACFSAAESAQTLRAQGHLHEAHERLLTCSQQGCPAAVQSDCTKWLGEVAGQIPSIVVQAHDAAGNDLADVRVVIDGVAVADRLDGRPMELDPGPHTVHLEHAGAQPVDRTLILVAGQKARVVEAQMAPLVATVQAPPEVKGPSFLSTIPTPTLVLGAVGAAGLVSTAVFWAWGRSQYSSLQGSCSPSCDPSDVGGVRTKLVVGDVSLGVAIVALGAGAWFYLTGRKQPEPTPEAAHIVIQPAPGGGLIGVAADL